MERKTRIAFFALIPLVALFTLFSLWARGTDDPYRARLTNRTSWSGRTRGTNRAGLTDGAGGARRTSRPGRTRGADRACFTDGARRTGRTGGPIGTGRTCFTHRTSGSRRSGSALRSRRPSLTLTAGEEKDTRDSNSKQCGFHSYSPRSE
jgi:hypothetical protein